MSDYIDVDDLPASTVEDLDPTPEVPRSRLYWRELLLGLLLVVGVLGWSGWQWWHQQAIQTHYRIAQDAVSHLDLDTALVQFRAAAEYRDAASRATDLAKQITQRNTQYDVARAALQSQKWAEALKAIKAVEEVHPRYKNINTLRIEVERQVYRGSVAGSIALRDRGPQPGLYYRSSASWVWLQDSDRYSTILGSGVEGRLIYDVPGPGWQPGARPTPQPDYMADRPGSPELQGRQLMLATIENDNVTAIPIALDPAEYDFYSYGAQGVWALRYHDRSAQVQSGGMLTDISAYYDIDYQAYDNTVTRTVHLPGPGWFFTDLSADGKHALVAETNDGKSNSIYLSGPEGFDRTLVYTTSGSIIEALVSPDGKYVLVRTQTIRENALYVNRLIVLVDVEHRTQHILAVDDIKTSPPSNSYPARVYFATGGPYAGKILLMRLVDHELELQVINPAHPATPEVALPLGFASADELDAVGSVFLDQTPGKQLLFALQRRPGANPFSMGSSAIITQGVAGHNPVSTTLQLAPSDYLASIQVVGENLLYGTINIRGRADPSESSTYVLRSMPLSSLASADQRPITIFTDTMPIVTTIAPSNSAAAGPSLFAYLQGTQLRVRTYDGAVDVALENGVEKLYSMGVIRYSNQYWLR